jgi:hypothetical protein
MSVSSRQAHHVRITKKSKIFITPNYFAVIASGDFSDNVFVSLPINSIVELENMPSIEHKA